MKYSKLRVTGSQFDQNWGWNQKSGWKHYTVWRGGGGEKEEAKPDRSFTPQFWIWLIYAFTIAAAHILFIDEII